MRTRKTEKGISRAVHTVIGKNYINSTPVSVCVIVFPVFLRKTCALAHSKCTATSESVCVCPKFRRQLCFDSQASARTNMIFSASTSAPAPGSAIKPHAESASAMNQRKQIKPHAVRSKQKAITGHLNNNSTAHATRRPGYDQRKMLSQHPHHYLAHIRII